jgi:hypothetical protein
MTGNLSPFTSAECDILQLVKQGIDLVPSRVMPDMIQLTLVSGRASKPLDLKPYLLLRYLSTEKV